MPRIQQLSPHVADLIAAGEVVERPASAAKELVENAVDAGASHITVELKNGGMTFLRVTDDGCGMSAEDAQLAFLRHATSKLRTAADLEAIGTLGFRGEALAAISAVSRVDLLTRMADMPLGTSLHLEAGVVTECAEAGSPVGTTIIVRDLFYNTPARMKYMKNDNAEAAALLACVQHQALAHPEVAFRVLRDGAEQLSTPGNGKLYSAVYAVWGRMNTQGLTEVKGGWDKLRLSGFVSRPSATRGNRSNQLFFVNGRFIRSRTMTAALEEAYRNQLLPGRFPSCVLHLSMPENLVDVNVHPAKTEIKFLREREVFDCVHYGVLTALNGAPGQVEMQLPVQPEKKQPELRDSAPRLSARPQPEAGFHTMTTEEYRALAGIVKQTPRVVPAEAVRRSVAPEHSAEARVAPQPEPAPGSTAAPESAPEPTPAPQPEQQTLAPAEDTRFRIAGELFDTYILVEQDDRLLLIDKHAAHERLLFEKLRAQKLAPMSQYLLQPVLYEPERSESALLLENAPVLERLGYELADYGGGTIAVRRLPADLDPSQAVASLDALAAQLSAGRQLSPDDLRDELLHTVACKAAIKGGDHSNPAELEALVHEVLTRDDLKYCPHGRPICAELTRRQLERQFRRV